MIASPTVNANGANLGNCFGCRASGEIDLEQRNASAAEVFANKSGSRSSDNRRHEFQVLRAFCIPRNACPYGSTPDVHNPPCLFGPLPPPAARRAIHVTVSIVLANLTLQTIGVGRAYVLIASLAVETTFRLSTTRGTNRIKTRIVMQLRNGDGSLAQRLLIVWFSSVDF